jgi:hypothetical protein
MGIMSGVPLDILLKDYIQKEVNTPTFLLKCNSETNTSESTLNGFKEIVSEIEDIYPGIDKWFEKKVLPGIKNGTRFAYLIIHNNKVIGESIVKPGKNAKLCSLRIKPEYQNKSMGLLLFAKIASTLDYNSKSIYSS